MEVLEVLQKCTVKENTVTLPDIQLDRKTYLAVAQKLELIGGKWNRKAKGFIFEQDPAELLADIQNGQNRNLKKEFQFFETPEELADKLCSYLPKSDISEILEPSAGRGSIVRAVNKCRGDVPVYYCELMELNRKMFNGKATFICDDFLKLPDENKFDVVIANPPFNKNQDIEHFVKMVNVCKRRVISVMSTHWMYCGGKKEEGFKLFLSKRKHQIIELDSGAFKDSGTLVKACIVILDK